MQSDQCYFCKLDYLPEDLNFDAFPKIGPICSDCYQDSIHFSNKLYEIIIERRKSSGQDKIREKAN